MEDLLAVDDDARAAAIASVVRAAEEEATQQDLHRIGALAAPALQPALAEAGFVVDDYTYTLLVHRPSSAVPAPVIVLARWYLTRMTDPAAMPPPPSTWNPLDRSRALHVLVRQEMVPGALGHRGSHRAVNGP